MLKAFVQELVKPNTVHEQATVHTIDLIWRDALGDQLLSVNLIPLNGHLLLGLENDARNVEVLGILKSLIDPRLQHLGAHVEAASCWLGAASEFGFECHLAFLSCIIGSGRGGRFRACSDCRTVVSSALAGEVLSQLLGHDRDVQEALEGSRLGAVDLGQLEGAARVPWRGL